MGKEMERERIRHTNVRLSSADTYILFLVRSENGVSFLSLILSDIPLGLFPLDTVIELQIDLDLLKTETHTSVSVLLSQRSK